MSAKSKFEHSYGHGKSKHRDYSVGVEVNQKGVRIGGFEPYCNQNHKDGESPMKEESAKGSFLRVLSGVHPRLSEKPVKLFADD